MAPQDCLRRGDIRSGDTVISASCAGCGKAHTGKERGQVARDRFHSAVRGALQKGGWTIIADPYLVRFDRTTVEIDLAAEQFLAAEHAERKIAVEVKSFLGPSRIYDFHLALGQFLTYRMAIEHHDPERLLYLAVPADVYEQVFDGSMVRRIMHQYQVRLLVFDPIREEITTWEG
jgi:hypothetical protein